MAIYLHCAQSLCSANSTSTNQARIRIDTTGLGSISSAGLYNGSTQILSFTDAQHQFEDGSLDRTFTLTPEQAQAIMANPSAYSVTLGTQDFPNGAISGSLQSMNTFSGTFSGLNVVGTTGARNGGGSFIATIVPDPSGSGSLLNYTFTPTGIGNSITGLQLNIGNAGTNGSLFANLSGNASLTNGTLSGSVPLTAAQTQQLMSNPNDYYVTANTVDFPSGAIRAQIGSTSNVYIVPVAGSVSGANGSQWETAISIFNSSYGSPATVTIQRLAAGNSSNANSNGSMNASNTTTITVPARGVTALDTAMSTLFGLDNSMGALMFTSDQPITITTNIYNDQRANNRGTFGEQVRALSPWDAISSGVLTGITGGPGSASHTNIGFYNPNSTAVTVKLNLGGMDGNSSSTSSIVLQPYGMLQLPSMGGTGTLFPSFTSAMNGGVITFQASAPIFAYASSVDNGSGDAGFVEADEDGAATPIAEAQVAAIANTINEGEVQEATAVQGRVTNASVQQYAQRMITDHTAALQQAQDVFSAAGITPQDNALSLALQQHTQNELAQLDAMSGTALNRQYMQEQVDDHQNVLQTIDAVLLPSAQTASVRTLLQTMRAQVADHLQSAQQILNTLP